MSSQRPTADKLAAPLEDTLPQGARMLPEAHHRSNSSPASDNFSATSVVPELSTEWFLLFVFVAIALLQRTRLAQTAALMP
jgi:hypothetical protein